MIARECMQIQSKLPRRSFIALSIRLLCFFFPLNIFPQMDFRDFDGYRHGFAFPESRLGDRHVASETRKECSMGFYGRHMRLEGVIPGSRNFASCNGRSDVRPDKRNFEGHRTRLSVDRRSLRALDRFDASPSCVFAFVQTGIARGK